MHLSRVKAYFIYFTYCISSFKFGIQKHIETNVHNTLDQLLLIQTCIPLKIDPLKEEMMSEGLLIWNVSLLLCCGEEGSFQKYRHWSYKDAIDIIHMYMTLCICTSYQHIYFKAKHFSESITETRVELWCCKTELECRRGTRQENTGRVKVTSRGPHPC